MEVQTVVMTSMSILLALTLEIDITSVAKYSGDFYQGMLGCDVLCMHSKLLSPATTALPGLG